MKKLKITFSDLLWPMYVKIDGELKSIKRIELKSDATTILIHTITDVGLEEEYKCFSDFSKYYHLRCLLSADIHIISANICGNKEHIIQMTLILLRIDDQLQCIVGLTYITGTKNFMVTTQSTNNDQIRTSICSPESTHYPFVEALLKNPPPNHIKIQKGKFWRLFATDIFLPGDLECGNAEPTNWKHQLEISISQSHTNTTLNIVKFNCKWTSVNLGEFKTTNIFWLPDGSPLQVRIDPGETLPTVVVIPIPARTAEFTNLFVTLTIADRKLATPILDSTENRRLVDLLAYMKANLGTYTGVLLINLLHETCNLYELEFKR